MLLSILPNLGLAALIFICAVVLLVAFFREAPPDRDTGKPPYYAPKPPEAAAPPPAHTIITRGKGHREFHIASVPVEVLELFFDGMNRIIHHPIGPMENETSAAYRRLAHEVEQRIAEALRQP